MFGSTFVNPGGGGGGGGVVVEFNSEDIYRVNSPGGTSGFTGLIATLPGGAVLTYTPTSGNEASMVPATPNQLAKLVLHNTTKGTDALIIGCNTGTNTLTFKENIPNGWAVGNVITTLSQTVIGSGFNMVDIELTDPKLIGISALWFTQLMNSPVANDRFTTHPYESFSVSKYKNQLVAVATVISEGERILPINFNRMSLFWTGTPYAPILRLAGYIP